jgi:hypothetical protein
LWYKTYDTYGKQFGGTVEQLPDGGFITGGACLIRTDRDGNLLWSELTSDDFQSWGTTVVPNGDGSYTVAGGARSSITNIAPIILRTMAGENTATIATPTITQTITPTVTPTVTPGATPIITPTAIPTITPTATPKAIPTAAQTAAPTVTPAAIVSHTPSAGPSPVIHSTLDLGWVRTVGMAAGIFVLIAGILVVLLIIVLIVDERINRPRKK